MITWYFENTFGNAGLILKDYSTGTVLSVQNSAVCHCWWNTPHCKYQSYIQKKIITDPRVTIQNLNQMFQFLSHYRFSIFREEKLKKKRLLLKLKCSLFFSKSNKFLGCYLFSPHIKCLNFCGKIPLLIQLFWRKISKLLLGGNDEEWSQKNGNGIQSMHFFINNEIWLDCFIFHWKTQQNLVWHI